MIKMKYQTKILLLCTFFTSRHYGAEVSSRPICSVYTQNSILDQTESFKPLHIGTAGQRYATCTGAVWYHTDYVAVLNLLGNTISVYKFDAETVTFSLHQLIDNTKYVSFKKPENLVVSSDESLLAVGVDNPHAGVYLYAINRETHLIEPEPIFFTQSPSLVHGVRFVGQDRYLVTVGWDKRRPICVYRIKKQGEAIELELVSSKKIKFASAVKPKSIFFTQNNKFAIIAYTSKAADTPGIIKNYFTVHTFDAKRGKLSDPLYVKESAGMCGPEDSALFNNDTALVVSNQGNHTLAVYSFNPESGQLSDEYTVIENPEAQLSFPHGLSVSQDGKYLLVTNYGDDKFNLYAIN